MRLFIATPEDVIIFETRMVEARESQRQIEDVAGILRVRGESLDRAYIEKWVQELQLQTQFEQALTSIGLASGAPWQSREKAGGACAQRASLICQRPRTDD